MLHCFRTKTYPWFFKQRRTLIHISGSAVTHGHASVWTDTVFGVSHATCKANPRAHRRRTPEAQQRRRLCASLQHLESLRSEWEISEASESTSGVAASETALVEMCLAWRPCVCIQGIQKGSSWQRLLEKKGTYSSKIKNQSGSRSSWVADEFWLAFESLFTAKTNKNSVSRNRGGPCLHQS